MMILLMLLKLGQEEEDVQVRWVGHGIFRYSRMDGTMQDARTPILI